MSKITMSTIKSFIRKNKGKVYIRNLSNFDAMVDGIRPVDNKGWRLAGEAKHSNEMGLVGAWFVGQSRDRLQALNEGEFVGYHVHNYCGSFDIAVKLEQVKAAE